MSKPIICLALDQEADLISSKFQLVQTGVGKINATYALTKVLAEREQAPPFILNIGSCGGIGVPQGVLIWADEFVQADMDASPLGFGVGQTPFDDGPAVLTPSWQPPFDMQHAARCATQDHFVTKATSKTAQLFDMEAYALAKVAQRYDLPFAAIKYVTDGADGSAAQAWQANLAKCRSDLTDLIKKMDAYVDA